MVLSEDGKLISTQPYEVAIYVFIKLYENTVLNVGNLSYLRSLKQLMKPTFLKQNG